MDIPFIDIKAQYRRLEAEIQKAIDNVLQHGRFIMGPEIARLEEELARFAGTEHALGCGSGTDALILPLLALGLGPGDAVFTSPFTFIATAEVISLLGATPVFVDIDPRTYNIDPLDLGRKISMVEREGRLKPRAVIPVDLFGLAADYDPIMALANEKGLFVLEDAAQSFGGSYRGRQAGSLGHAGATSFFPAKPLGCYGDGGAIFTNDRTFWDHLASLRVHGQGSDKYDNVRIGLNGRLDTIQAAVLLVKLGVFPEELEARQKAAARYSSNLKDHVVTPFIPAEYVSAWAQYSILVDNREEVLSALKEAGIPTAIYYPKPLHLQDAFRDLGYKKGDFPVSEDAAGKIFSLPMHPYLTDETIDYISEKVIAGVQTGGRRER